MKRLAAFLLIAAATTFSEIRYFRYERVVQNVPRGENPTCLAIDAALFAHAAPGVADLRLYRDHTETPYLVRMSTPTPYSSGQTIELLNLGMRGGQTVFDAAMPSGPYSDLLVKLRAKDFIATVSVAGSQQQTGPATKIGDFTIFDLTGQKLGRSTVLHLPRSDFRFLHFRIAGPLRPENVGSLTVEQWLGPEPEYALVADSTQVTQRDRSTIVEFEVPAHVPVDRILFLPGATPANFSRDVTVEIRPVAPAPTDSAEPPAPVTATGNLLRVHILQNDHHIDQENLAVDPPRATFDSPSKWTISIDNGDNAPLLPSAVRLQMLRRDLCFESTSGDYTLYYGDEKLSPPRYDLGQFFVVKDAAQATAGPEQPNPEYQPRPDDRPFTEKHPLLLWFALALVIAVLGAIALRSAKVTKPQQS